MTDGNSIYVNYAGVGNVVDIVQQANNTINSAFDNLENELAPLRATWSGASDQEFTAFSARYNNDYANMQAILPKITQAIGDMSDNYSTTDNRLASQWAQNP